jgi:hypothetical protein
MSAEHPSIREITRAVAQAAGIEGAHADEYAAALLVVLGAAEGYTRGVGFDDSSEIPFDLRSVLITAALRFARNPAGIAVTKTAGPYTETLAGGFTGWTLAELAVLNRYRVTSA